MFKIIGVITTLAIGATGAAVWMGDLDFQANAKLTEKGQREIRDLRNVLADKISDNGK